MPSMRFETPPAMLGAARQVTTHECPMSVMHYGPFVDIPWILTSPVLKNGCRANMAVSENMSVRRKTKEDHKSCRRRGN